MYGRQPGLRSWRRSLQWPRGATMNIFRHSIRLSLYAACAVALLIAGEALLGAILFALFPPDHPSPVYTRLQLSLYSDLATTMVPAVIGFLALTGGAVGYLQKTEALDRREFQLGIFIVFSLAVVSLACWIALFGAIGDAAIRFGESGTLDRLPVEVLFHVEYVEVLSTSLYRIGGSTFFAAIGVVAILGTYFVEIRPKIK